MALNRALRLRKSSEFQRVRQQGRSSTSRLLILSYAPNDLAKLRIGFVVSKRISKQAVERNHLKRLLGEAIRPSLPELSRRWDLILSARNAANTASLAELEKDLGTLLHRAQLLMPGQTSVATSDGSTNGRT
ncbi:MAG TPA: ribonuclease P protein component [Ktedonobacteraceae bacterium]|nr:ribonuclease P protein component [Ktedonobacteraceae bacterium]